MEPNLHLIDKRGTEKAVLYSALNRKALELWRLFEQISQIDYIRDGRLPSAEELARTPLPAELEQAKAPDKHAQSMLDALPREFRPFFNIIPLLLLYFRNLRDCLAEHRAKAGEEASESCSNWFADLRNMAEGLPREWRKRQALMDEAAIMLEAYRTAGGDAQPPETEGELGALGLFIESSKIKKYK